MRIHYIVAVALAFVALPLAAQSNDIGVWYSTAHLASSSDSDGLTFDHAKGYGVSFDHFWSGSLSTELAAYRLHANGGIDIAGTQAIDTGQLKIMPITANIQWHIAHGSMFSPYIGAGVAYVKTDDLSSSDLDVAGIGTVTIGKKTTWDANAGFDIGLGRALAVAIDGKYIKYEPDSSAAGTTEKLKINPLVISAGLKLRW